MYLVFDIGGTHVRSAFSTDGKAFDAPPIILDTPKTWEDAQKLISELCKKHGKPKRVCVAIAGEFDSYGSSLVFSPNLPDWVGKPLRRFFEKESGAPVTLVNDSVAAALAEAREGAGKGHSIVAYLTIGTGVGGARIVNGNVDENRHGFEPGHQIIDVVTGDTLESRVAGSGFSRRFGPDFVRSAPDDAWNEAAREFAMGVHNTIELWSPDIVVVGGAMILKAKGISLESVVAHLSTLNRSSETLPSVVRAKFGDESGLRGALSLARGE